MKYQKRPHSTTHDYKKRKIGDGGDIELINRKSIDSRTDTGSKSVKVKKSNSRGKKLSR